MASLRPPARRGESQVKDDLSLIEAVGLVIGLLGGALSVLFLLVKFIKWAWIN